jgi:sulfur carrier protein
MPTITVNGTSGEVAPGTSLLALLQTKTIDPLHVVAEVNGTVVPREQFTEHLLKTGDTVEVIRFVGGG